MMNIKAMTMRIRNIAGLTCDGGETSFSLTAVEEKWLKKLGQFCNSIICCGGTLIIVAVLFQKDTAINF
jgi:hypothetical protein